MSLTDEQIEEFQVLESIYGEQFSVNDVEPNKAQIALDTAFGNVVVSFRVPCEYPEAVPDIGLVSCASHRIIGHDLLKAMGEEASRNLGQVMIFTLCTFLQEWVELCAKKTANTSSVRILGSGQGASEQEKTAQHTVIETKVLAEGTPVNRETFLAWKERFHAERAKQDPTQSSLSKESRVTGKRLFEQNRSLATSDAFLAEDEVGVEIDLSAFAGVNLDDFGSENEDEA